MLSWYPDLRRDPALVASLIEARRIIEPAAAGLAAARATAAELAAIEAAYLGMAAALPDDIAACCEADLAFHAGVVAASHNIVLRSLVDTIEAALRATFAITNRLMATQSRALAAHHDVLERVRLRDAAGASRSMHRLLDVAAQDLEG